VAVPLDEEELVLVVVLVPVELALDDSEPHGCVVDGREGLVEKGLARRVTSEQPTRSPISAAGRPSTAMRTIRARSQSPPLGDC
jgi:hypothetical protein